jgi:hypothetical protein
VSVDVLHRGVADLTGSLRLILGFSGEGEAHGEIISLS